MVGRIFDESSYSFSVNSQLMRSFLFISIFCESQNSALLTSCSSELHHDDDGFVAAKAEIAVGRGLGLQRQLAVSAQRAAHNRCHNGDAAKGHSAEAAKYFFGRGFFLQFVIRVHVLLTRGFRSNVRRHLSNDCGFGSENYSFSDTQMRS